MNKKNVLLTISVMLIPLLAISQGTSVTAEETAYSAYLKNSISLWEQAEKKAEERYNDNKAQTDFLYHLALIRYGKLLACIPNQDKINFKLTIKDAENDVETLMISEEYAAKAQALRAGLYSVEMAFVPIKGMVLGPKSSKLIENAIRLDDKEPLAWYEKGGSLFHTPEQYGGDPAQSVTCFKKAIDLMEDGDDKYLQNNWLYLNSLAWLGQAYLKTGNKAEAKDTFEKAINIEPEFGWVKHLLLPKATN